MLVLVVYLLLLPLASGLSAGACDCVGGENFNVSGWNGAAAAGADAALAGSISAAVLPGACLNATFAECDDPSSAINGAPECEPAVLDDFVASISSGSIENCSGSLLMFEWLSALAQQCQSTGAFISSQGMRRILCSPSTPFFDLDALDTAAGIFLIGTSYKLPIDAWQGFYAADIAGWQWVSMLPKDYEDLGFTKGEAYGAYEGAQGTVDKYGEPGEYAWPGLDDILGPTIITPQIVLQRLIDVRSPEYFEVEYLVTLSWEDQRIFSECNGTVKSTEAKDPGRKVDTCDIYWRPELQLPNALDGEV